MIQWSLYFVSILVEQGCLLEHLVIKTGLGEGEDNPLLNLFFIVNKGKVAKSFESTLLDQFLAGAVAHTERVDALVVTALA